MRAYPTNLFPLPRVDEYSEALSPNGVRTRMDGKINQEPRYSGSADVKSVTFNLSGAQWWAFQAFVFHLLHNGADWFTMELPGAADNVTEQVCRFVDGKYDSKFVNERWVVTAALELRQEAPVDA
jgi:hypothetical protein